MRGAKAAYLAGGLFLMGGLALGGYLAAIHVTGNFNEVVPNELYRSAQLSPAQIALYQQRYGIQTIVNLRGENFGAPWYDAEVGQAKKLGITHVNFRMSAKRELTQAQAAELIKLLAEAKKPILIHCQAGADRSGLASALYLAAVSKRGEAAAESQISIRYGHISLPVSPAYTMDRSFESLEPWLGYHDS